jgi:hypothetical protein
MKKVINGLLYNTQTAESISENDNGLDRGFFNYCCETIYKTKKGRYFLHGDGGATSKYGIQSNGFRREGEDIILLTEKEVKEYLENWNDIDKYEELFGILEEA